LTTDEPITAGERYAIASTSGNLSPSATRRTDADILLAAAYAALRGKNADEREHKMLALAIYRMGATGDLRDLWSIVERCDSWMAGWLSRGGRRQLPADVRRGIVVDVLRWWTDPLCHYCGGTGRTVIEGTAGILGSPCSACQGTKKRPLAREVPRVYAPHAQWLADELGRYAAIVTGDMAKLLAREMEL